MYIYFSGMVDSVRVIWRLERKVSQHCKHIYFTPAERGGSWVLVSGDYMNLRMVLTFI